MISIPIFCSQIHLTPLEVAIIGMQDKIQSLRRTLEQDPPDGKLLQMQLQGGIATTVNQVIISVICFLAGALSVLYCRVLFT